ncbi:MAG TPA: porin, partial [Gammaproteobacteria bacterium]
TAGTCAASGGTTCTITVAAGSAAKPADSNDTDVWGLRAKYNFGDFWVDANYGNSDAGTGGAEVDGFAIEFGATFDTNQVTIAYRNNESDSAGTSKDADVDDWAINLRHFMSKTTRVFVEYRNTDDDSKADEVDMFAVGLRHDWKL